MNNTDIFHLVVEAVAHSNIVTGNLRGFNRTAKNRLRDMHKEYILTVLRELRNQAQVIDMRLPGDKDHIKGAHVLGTFRRDPRTGILELGPANAAEKEATHQYEFMFHRKDNFESWYSTYLLKRNSDFESLNPLNQDKVWITVLDIEEKLQMSPSEKISIPLFFEHYTELIPTKYKTGHHRADALKFLKDRGIVKSFEIRPLDDLSYVIVSLDLAKFQKFKEKLNEIYGRRQKEPGKPVREKDALETSASEGIKDEKNELVYRVEYTAGREIILNRLILTKLQFEGENDKVFGYLHKNPNRNVNLDELVKANGAPLAKSLHKIIENLGFWPEIKNLFFEVSKTKVLFRNPITRRFLAEKGVKLVRLPRRLPPS